MLDWRPFGWTWNRLAKQNALGAILTIDGKLGNWSVGEFLATGKAQLDRFMDDLNRVSPGTAHGRALDFGCGVGRITRGLADHFTEVVGVDVSPAMIDQARALHADRDRITWVVNRKPHLKRFATDSFDVIYCRIVFQHIRPPIVEGYIAELLRVLKPDGMLMFQLPEATSLDSERAFAERVFMEAPVIGGWKQKLPKPIVRAWRRFKRFKYRLLIEPGRMEMFGINRPNVEAVIAKAGGRLIWAKPDNSHDLDGLGFEYWVTGR